MERTPPDKKTPVLDIHKSANADALKKRVDVCPITVNSKDDCNVNLVEFGSESTFMY